MRAEDAVDRVLAQSKAALQDQIAQQDSRAGPYEPRTQPLQPSCDINNVIPRPRQFNLALALRTGDLRRAERAVPAILGSFHVGDPVE